MMSTHRTLTAAFAAAALTLTACTQQEDPEPPEESQQPEATAQSEETQDATTPTPSEPTEPSPTEPTTTPDGEEVLQQQGVSAGHPLAAEAGERILSQGGNAVDAAVATAFAVSVVEPFASGIGGGGSAIIAGQDGEPEFLDYREVVAESGEIPASDAGIPGFVAGMGQLHAADGNLEWAEVLEPARELAEEGFSVSDFLATRIAADDGQAALAGLDEFTGGDGPLSAGEELVQPELAETLETLQNNGWEDFYTGELAESLSQQTDGIDAESLQSYQTQEREPAHGEVGEYQVLAASGSLPGAQMIDMLQQVESAGIAEMLPDSADYVEELSQAWLEAEEQVLTQLGEQGTSAQASSGQVGASQEATEQSANTTHISVVDEDGTAVSMTNTIMYFWGSGEQVDGYFLNNHLSRFAAIDSPANQPEPGGRTTTWSNPAMVLDDQDRPVLVIGSPGGHQILNIMGTVLTQLLLQDAELKQAHLEEALASPRFRAEDNTLYAEESFSGDVIEQLETQGWDIEVWPDEQASFGSVQPLLVDYEESTVTSADDSRRDGAHRILQ